MLALSYAKYGDPSVLELRQLPEPHAGPGEVRIAVRAAGVNPTDWKFRSGLLKDAFPMRLPAIVGFEASGVIDEVGAGVDGVRVGDEVFGVGSATSAEFAVLDHFSHKPAALSWEQAAGLALVAETALRGLELLGVASGQTLLIEGAAGGVGSAAAQFAIARGLSVIGTASEPNHEYLRSLGVVPTTYGPGLRNRVAVLAPGGIDVVLDAAGKGSLKNLVAIAGGPEKVVTLADFSAAEHNVRLTVAPGAFHALPEAARLFEEGRYTVAVDSQFGLADAAKAHERSEAGHLRGKIILKIAED
jgi:NADPH:quinone reductase-like Zn-dependent oxidoreductase